MEHERSATIYSVAASAGVSIATVSRVLNNRDAASPALRDRVLKAVEELDYVPRQAARSLAEGAQQAYGLVVGDLVGAYYPPLVIGFEGDPRAAAVAASCCRSRTPPASRRSLRATC